jgi:hypothetical protein
VADASMSTTTICFGQQPCGFFPKRFLFAKIRTARRLQYELGGEIVFFYHDSDHDSRETRTVLRDPKRNEAQQFNFAIRNRMQRKYSPLYCKEIDECWYERTARQLPNYVGKELVQVFRNSCERKVADFCLETYLRLGLLSDIRIVRSSSPDFRAAACDISDFFVDVPHEGEIVRARFVDGRLKLHEGGESYIILQTAVFTKNQVSPTRDTRFHWMQSVVNCSHYVTGASEQEYLHPNQNPDVTFVHRDPIERSDEAYTDFE